MNGQRRFLPLLHLTHDFLQYTVMAFGMRNAPATFQCLMNVVLSGLPFCEAYLHDLVVCTES